MILFEIFFLVVFLACALIFSYAVIWGVIEIRQTKEVEPIQGTLLNYQEIRELPENEDTFEILYDG